MVFDVVIFVVLTFSLFYYDAIKLLSSVRSRLATFYDQNLRMAVEREKKIFFKKHGWINQVAIKIPKIK